MKKLSIKPDFEQICASSVAWLQSFKHFFRSGETQLEVWKPSFEKMKRIFLQIYTNIMN